MPKYNVEAWLRHKGKYYKKGDTIDSRLLNPNQQKQLVKKGVITLPSDYSTVLNDDNEEIDDNNNKTPDGEESIEEILDLNFEWDELKEEAKSIGLEWKGNISKENLIKLIIENGEENHFLEQLEDDGDEEEGDLDVQNI